MNLGELADRVEALAAPCRETDAAIHCALDPRGLRATKVSEVGPYGPRYTHSLDAAMSLVPEGACWRAYAWPRTDTACAMVEGGPEIFAATPALALAAASLRARERGEG